jgi:hypothetical protein
MKYFISVLAYYILLVTLPALVSSEVCLGSVPDCNCGEENKSVTCLWLESVEDLQRVFEEANLAPVVSVYLQSCYFETLPRTAFGNVSLSQFSLYSSDVVTIESGVFDNSFDTLTYFSIGGNSNLASFDFSDFK